MSELKPCPFCGGEAETHETIDGWIASCSSEQSELDGFTHKAQAYGTTKAEAIAAWNKRHERTCKPIEEYLDNYSDLTVTVCSNCRVAIDDLEDCYYCPNCGAKVIGD